LVHANALDLLVAEGDLFSRRVEGRVGKVYDQPQGPFDSFQFWCERATGNDFENRASVAGNNPNGLHLDGVARLRAGLGSDWQRGQSGQNRDTA
jgi:hypothetical protein